LSPDALKREEENGGVLKRVFKFTVDVEIHGSREAIQHPKRCLRSIKQNSFHLS
jgi:hypothetical protein